ncbi:MAG: sugar phosphate isomerase/epimerase family protein [bacterium]
MRTSRREFLRTSAFALAGGALLAKTGCSFTSAVQKKPVTAVQLYCVREDMQRDPGGSLKKLADMGYTHVEHANYVDHKFYGWTAAEFRKVLDDLGLKMPSGHTVLSPNHWDESAGDFTAEWKKLLDDAAYMGQEYVISPWMDPAMYSTYDNFMRFMEIFNKSGELCQKQGMRFGYHNHDFEFSETLNGETLWDLIMNNTDADKVVMQLDTGNMYTAGAKAKEVLSQYPGRYDNIHAKDMIQRTDGGYESCVLGEGLVGVKEALDLAADSGTRLIIIEQESYQGKTPMERMEENLAVMKSWGY